MELTATIWFDGHRYALPRGEHKGKNLRAFFGVKETHDLFVEMDEGDDVKFLTTPGAIGEGFRKATEWVDAAVLAVRHATDPNPFRNASEEEICGEILRKLEEKKTVTQ